jgi:Domain of unknown function (DUF2019)
MMRPSVQSMTVDQLIERFAALGVEQDKAITADDNLKYEPVYAQMSAVRDELRSRPGDQRKALLTLVDYPNMQVRLRAAQYALAVAPAAARRTIEAIAASTWPPQCYDARMCLRMLDEGKFISE